MPTDEEMCRAELFIGVREIVIDLLGIASIDELYKKMKVSDTKDDSHRTAIFTIPFTEENDGKKKPIEYEVKLTIKAPIERVDAK